METEHTSIYNETEGTYIMDADIRRAIIIAVDEDINTIDIDGTMVHIHPPITKDNIRQINIEVIS